MITKYTEYIKESVDSYFFQTYEETKDWLDKMEIIKYTINVDLSVDVNNHVKIDYKQLHKIPVNFNKIYGDFSCYHNYLTSLKGCPKIVNGKFSCSNNYLTSLKGCPSTVDKSFYCNNNELKTLEYCPSTITGSFYCTDNNLTSLKGCPEIIDGSFACRNNPYLEDINDLDSKILIDNMEDIRVKQEVWDKYFDYWIDKDINIFNVLKDKVSDDIKQKYSHLFNANNFDLL